MRSNKFYQRHTMQRIPRTATEAKDFLYHAIEHIQSELVFPAQLAHAELLFYPVALLTRKIVEIQKESH